MSVVVASDGWLRHRFPSRRPRSDMDGDAGDTGDVGDADDAAGRALDEFLAGDRPDEVAFFLADDELDDESAAALVPRGTSVDGGLVLVLPGDRGRSAFAAGTGTDAMTFAGEAMEAEGEIAPGLDGGTCPNATGHADGTGAGGKDEDGDQAEEKNDDDHALRYLLAFAEERNEDVGGIYAEGDVIHAYARCTCGTAYSDKWVAGDR